MFCDITVIYGLFWLLFLFDFIIDRRGCFIQPMKIQKLLKINGSVWPSFTGFLYPLEKFILIEIVFYNSAQ